MRTNRTDVNFWNYFFWATIFTHKNIENRINDRQTVRPIIFLLRSMCVLILWQLSMNCLWLLVCCRLAHTQYWRKRPYAARWSHPGTERHKKSTTDPETQCQPHGLRSEIRGDGVLAGRTSRFRSGLLSEVRFIFLACVKTIKSAGW